VNITPDRRSALRTVFAGRKQKLPVVPVFVMNRIGSEPALVDFAQKPRLAA
jgi:hypothetical protein